MTVFTNFFDSKYPAAVIGSKLQNGSKLASVIATEAKQAKGISVKVSKVLLPNPNLAYLTYTLYMLGNPVLPNASGYAVRENGAWKVSARTFCGLVQLSGAAAPACNDPSVVALPS